MNTHLPYKAGTRLDIHVSLVFTAWKQLLIKSGTGISVKDLELYLLLNKKTLMYDVLHHRDDGYYATDQLGDLARVPQEVHTQLRITHTAWYRTG